jgi:protein-S-isoprenylcysteine O-methyltransferase Ste14
VAWDIAGYGRWLLWGVQAAGLVVTLRGAAVLDFRELSGLAAPRLATNDAPPTAPFKTTWPYGWVRHPIYAGWFLMLLPATPMTMTRLAFAGISCTYLLLAIPLEEATLRRTTGGAYAAYERTVRWRLLPRFY